MALELKRFPEFGVELHIKRGAFTSEDIIRYFRSLGPADALRWIYYYDTTAETSGLDLGHIPELRRTVMAKRKELFGDRPPPAPAVVCGPGGNREFFEFWARLVASGEPPAPAPLIFPTLRAACEGLGLPDAACEALERAVAAPQGDDERRPAEPNAAPPPQA
jgi:hypothetical protein